MSGTIHIYSGGLWRLRHEVAELTGLAPERRWWSAPREGTIAGWGHKPSAARARLAARRSGLPYVAFEDGFLRSLKPGPLQKPASMVIDRAGIYYDARQPSDLETMLERQEFSAAECAAASSLVDEIAARRLSKFNHGSGHEPHLRPAAGQPLVLLIDQTLGDESVAGGLAGAADFIAMAEAAVAENPGALLVAKLHPEVIAGRKDGYLMPAARRLGLRILAEDISPWVLIGRHPRVYTVSSQFGFEAMLGGCEVHCFGMPFYAGWGLTRDRRSLPGRTRQRSRAEIAAAVYLHYTRYFDVWRRRPVDAMTAVEQLDFQRRHYLANSRPVVALRIARWKRRAVAAMLDGPAGPPVFVFGRRRAEALARERSAAFAAWGMAAQRRRPALASQGIDVLAVEDGFIRSAGLGAAFVPPLSLVFDSRGIYYDPSQPSDIEHMLEAGSAGAAEVARAASLRERIVSQSVTKYNLGPASAPPVFPAGREVVLVVGQVADDAAVLAARDTAPAVGADVNAGLLAAVRRSHPEAYVVFKPHPDVELLGRRGALSAADIRNADRVVSRTPLQALFPLVRRIESFSSLAGFEALLRRMPVTVHGYPFYAGWGLTEDLHRFPRRTRKIALEELVAAALILYPRYWDPVSGLACPPEVVLDRLQDMRMKPPGLGRKLGWVAGRMTILLRRVRQRIGG